MIGADVEQWKLDLAKKLGTDMVVNVKETDLKQVLSFLNAFLTGNQ